MCRRCSGSSRAFCRAGVPAGWFASVSLAAPPGRAADQPPRRRRDRGNVCVSRSVQAEEVTRILTRGDASASSRQFGIVDADGSSATFTGPDRIVWNRAIAVAMADGPEAGIALVEQIATHAALRDYLPLSSTLGELWLRRGDRTRAAEHFTCALELPSTGPEKRFLLRKLQECR